MRARVPRWRRRLEERPPLTAEESARGDQERAAIEADPLLQKLGVVAEVLRARPHPPGRRPGGDEGD